MSKRAYGDGYLAGHTNGSLAECAQAWRGYVSPLPDPRGARPDRLPRRGASAHAPRCHGHVPANRDGAHCAHATSTRAAEGTDRPARLGEPIAIGRGGVRDAAFAPDLQTLAIGWANGVSLTRLDDLTDLWYWEAPGLVTALDLSDAWIAVLLANGDLWLLDAQDGTPAAHFPGAAAPGRTFALWGDVRWSPDGRLAAVQAFGGAGTAATPILLVDPAQRSVVEVPESRTEPGWQPYLTWSPDGRRVASTDRQRRAVVFDVDIGELVYQAAQASRIYAWPEDTRIVMDDERGLVLMDILSGQVVREFPDATPGFPPSPPVVVDREGARMLVGGAMVSEYAVEPYQVWDLTTGRPLPVPPVGESRHVNAAGCLLLHRPDVRLEGDRVLYLDSDGRLVRWRLGDAMGEAVGEVAVRLPCLGTPVVWSPEGSRLLLQTDPGAAVTVWEAATGALVAERRDGTFPADLHGDLLAYRGRQGDVLVRDLAAGSLAARLPGPATSFPGGMAFAPDGSWLAYGVDSGLVVAETAAGRDQVRLNGIPEGQQVSHIFWGPDGEALVAAAGSEADQDVPGALILWERQGDTFLEVLRLGTVQAHFTLPGSPLALFSPSGRWVALQEMPDWNAGSQRVLVYDRAQQEVVLDRPGFSLERWLAEEALLLRRESGGDVRPVAGEPPDGGGATRALGPLSRTYRRLRA